MPWQYTFRELDAMQQREGELWAERYTLSSGVAATAIAIGLPLSTMLITWGGFFVDDAINDGSYDDNSSRVTGAFMLTAGILALVGTGVSIWHVERVRKKRAAIDSELRALSASRSAIERMLQAELAGM